MDQQVIAPPTRSRRTQDSRAKLLVAARKLFVERGYHATRPQDISRDAGLGHGTFYLHFEDKQACFLAFTDQARAELADYSRSRVAAAVGMENAVRATLQAIFDYSNENPGVLVAAMADSTVITAENDSAATLSDQWATEWATVLSESGGWTQLDAADAGVIGAAIVGIIREGSAYARRHGGSVSRTVDLLTKLIVKAVS